jgi:hypothetical protein
VDDLQKGMDDFEDLSIVIKVLFFTSVQIVEIDDFLHLVIVIQQFASSFPSYLFILLHIPSFSLYRFSSLHLSLLLIS